MWKKKTPDKDRPCGMHIAHAVMHHKKMSFNWTLHRPPRYTVYTPCYHTKGNVTKYEISTFFFWGHLKILNGHIEYFLCCFMCRNCNHHCWCRSQVCKVESEPTCSAFNLFHIHGTAGLQMLLWALCVAVAILLLWSLEFRVKSCKHVKRCYYKRTQKCSFF